MHKTDQLSMCYNMILTIESNEFIDQWINSYALRQINFQCVLLLSNEFIDQWINTYALRQTDFNVF